MDTNVRNKLGVGFGVVAGVLALASVAFACTTYKGNMTFSPAGHPATTVTGIGGADPGAGGMTWCIGGNTAGTPAPGRFTSGVAQALGISSAPSTGLSGPCANAQLSNDSDGSLEDYTVAWVGGYMPAAPSKGEHINCHQESRVNVMGVYSVDATGAGTPASFNWTPVAGAGNPPKGYVNVCVFRGTAADPMGPGETPDANDQNFLKV